MDLTYHLALSLKEQICVIIGLGEVGQRKLTGLLATDVAYVHLFDPQLQASILPKDPRIRIYRRSYTIEDLRPALLVFACTNDTQENLRIATLCRKLHVLCNCTSTPTAGNVFIPATIRQDDLTLTIATGGASPALTRKWHEELSLWMQKRRAMLKFMGRLRPLLLALGKSSQENRALFRTLVHGPLEELLSAKNWQEALSYLKSTLPQALHKDLEVLLHDLP
ncbi:MAG: bifunctional precorrin-2 dehydrogenase/sirohydrochlorin ferrochelatase [Desulfovibrionaceae bacterium]|nr:bifunctional precorrin-2 dehydrogenase/sirohydrochlorin ferrochelatase [Desulfovibrionaceae bacterium]